MEKYRAKLLKILYHVPTENMANPVQGGLSSKRQPRICKMATCTYIHIEMEPIFT